ncbi:MAG: hypothetical protein J6X10_07040 [Bacteroidales bacterium]|nr:hypothetical protein [Bacteroidales bacterium]
MNDYLEQIKVLQEQIKLLEQKKASLSDAAEIKATNRQINELQMKCGALKKEYKNVKDFRNSIDREFNSIEISDD